MVEPGIKLSKNHDSDMTSTLTGGRVETPKFSGHTVIIGKGCMKCRQGVGRGLKTQKFCGRRMWMAPNAIMMSSELRVFQSSLSYSHHATSDNFFGRPFNLFPPAIMSHPLETQLHTRREIRLRHELRAANFERWDMSLLKANIPFLLHSFINL